MGGHSKVVKWLVKHVTQFPSDTELTRFIATISDKDLLKKTHQCLEIIRVAKEHQQVEANKAASILLEELEQEKTREESKKAAAARKREKKKRKKAEKRGKADDDDDDGDGEDEVEEKDNEKAVNGEATTEDEKEKSPEINCAEGDSGIDANSQGSGASNDKDEKSGKKKKNKKTKNKEKERNEKNGERNSEEKENNNIAANRGDSKEKTPGDDEERPDSRSDRNSQPRVPCTIEGHSALLPEAEKPKPEPAFIEAPRKGRNRVLRASDSGGEGKEAPGKQLQQQASSKGKASVGKAGPVPDAGWKEVVRKSKKVSVPSNAISRVIGRGGSNINAIRELSGAHIEVEKQSKGQGDRTILIKGSADATRLANQWISAIIASPDKDLADIVGRQQYKQLSTATLSKSSVVVSKTVVKTTTTTATTSKGKTAEVKAGKV